MSKKQESVKQVIKKSSEFIERIYSNDRFEKLSDGWIRDNLLWIDWAPSSEDYMNLKAAEGYCKKQGGRLPTIDELRLLIDYRRYNPAIFDIFKDTKSRWYWSGTMDVDPQFAGFAWCVGFGSGGVRYGHKGYDYYVRPVRASQ